MKAYSQIVTEIKESALEEASMKKWRVTTPTGVRTVSAASEKDAINKAMGNLAGFAKIDAKKKGTYKAELAEEKNENEDDMPASDNDEKLKDGVEKNTDKKKHPVADDDQFVAKNTKDKSRKADVKEEQENLDELNKNTLVSYVRKVGAEDKSKYSKKKKFNRRLGTEKAVARYDPSEVDDLDMGKYSSTNIINKVPKSYHKKNEPAKKRNVMDLIKGLVKKK